MQEPQIDEFKKQKEEKLIQQIQLRKDLETGLAELHRHNLMEYCFGTKYQLWK